MRNARSICVSLESWKTKFSVLAPIFHFRIHHTGFIWGSLLLAPVQNTGCIWDFYLFFVLRLWPRLMLSFKMHNKEKSSKLSLWGGYRLSCYDWLTSFLSGMLWCIILSFQMAAHHPKRDRLNLCYVTTRHHRLNITWMWTRCESHTTAAQLAYCLEEIIC